MIEVNGNQGWSWGPGYNLIGGKKYPKPGFVGWQEDDGVQYTITGSYGENGASGTSVEELLEIARSMSE